MMDVKGLMKAVGEENLLKHVSWVLFLFKAGVNQIVLH